MAEEYSQSLATVKAKINLHSLAGQGRRANGISQGCGDACSPHLPEVSRHYGVVVKCFASGQCSPGWIPDQSRSWSRRLESSKVYFQVDSIWYFQSCCDPLWGILCMKKLVCCDWPVNDLSWLSKNCLLGKIADRYECHTKKNYC